MGSASPAPSHVRPSKCLIRRCLWCGDQYATYVRDQELCSRACFGDRARVEKRLSGPRRRKRAIRRRCAWCGWKFFVPRQYPTQVCCSFRCASTRHASDRIESLRPVAVALYSCGFPCDDIAARLGVGVRTVQRLTRPPGADRRRDRTPPETIARALEMVASGSSQTATARAVNVSRMTLSRWLEAADEAA
jgi:transposase-like protein